ncbi:MAG: succinate dehydrogenase iron-sulfur subunit [Planctomycetes bacterium ADurb.Bin126]|mgnify:FL=1|nr:MAG: succinate dehydrogenase iron-sulfur subunit [Planctomycetes bacterium ADurb.Bin126]HOD80992.1 4Fe-4S dicluster domain-containing protein [Phycisphaerae bacterium]HQL73327.1 4Fe-4S dicluster domain-containing protein [Phycisphaerae bacterium]
MSHTQQSELGARIAEQTGMNVLECYQCGKCTAGCPMAKYMDLTPSQVMRLCQMSDEGAKEQVLRSGAIWTCAGCLTCTQRCPKQLDPAAAMDVLRELSNREKMTSPQRRKILAFHKAFLTTVRKTGRMSEFPLVRRYKISSRDFFSDVLLAPLMVAKGKLGFKAHKIKGRSQIKTIFQTCADLARK